MLERARRRLSGGHRSPRCCSAEMPVKVLIFDAYGTLLQNEDLRLIPRRIVADHGLSVPIDDVWRVWIDSTPRRRNCRRFGRSEKFRDRFCSACCDSLTLAPMRPLTVIFSFA